MGAGQVVDRAVARGLQQAPAQWPGQSRRLDLAPPLFPVHALEGKPHRRASERLLQPQGPLRHADAGDVSAHRRRHPDLRLGVDEGGDGLLRPQLPQGCIRAGCRAIFNEMTCRAGLPEAQVEGLSGQSARVGAVGDMVAACNELLKILLVVPAAVRRGRPFVITTIANCS